MSHKLQLGRCTNHFDAKFHLSHTSRLIMQHSHTTSLMRFKNMRIKIVSKSLLLFIERHFKSPDYLLGHTS